MSTPVHRPARTMQKQLKEKTIPEMNHINQGARS